jgi:hypothetical protein
VYADEIELAGGWDVKGILYSNYYDTETITFYFCPYSSKGNNVRIALSESALVVLRKAMLKYGEWVDVASQNNIEKMEREIPDSAITTTVQWSDSFGDTHSAHDFTLRFNFKIEDRYATSYFEIVSNRVFVSTSSFQLDPMSYSGFLASSIGMWFGQIEGLAYSISEKYIRSEIENHENQKKADSLFN